MLLIRPARNASSSRTRFRRASTSTSWRSKRPGNWWRVEQMAHLMESTRRMAENDPSLERLEKIPVGLMVQYHGRQGSMRQGRTVFPAVVLHQHPDDGSLDLIVFFEAEDMIWEQRVQRINASQMGHCWELVPPVEARVNTAYDVIFNVKGELLSAISELRLQMYGEFEEPTKSMIEYLDDFDKRLKKLEKR